MKVSAGELDERPPPSCERVARRAGDARARELIPGLWSLQLPLCYRPVTSVNAYLMRSERGWVLWDCGSALAPGWEAMQLALGQAGVRPGEVTTLIVSHAHTDHRGLAGEFVAHTGARLAASAPPHPMIDVIRDPVIGLEIRRERARREGVPGFAVNGIVDELPGMDTGYPDAGPELLLEPGMEVDTRCGTWEVLALPGHGADQIGMFNRDNRFLLSADLAFPGLAPYLEYGTRPDPHAEQVASLDRAIALGPELLLGGHGRPVPDAVTALRHCRGLTLERTERVLEVIRSGGMTGWDVAVTLTPAGAFNDRYQRSLSEALCVLEHLELEGRALGALDERRRRVWRAADA